MYVQIKISLITPSKYMASPNVYNKDLKLFLYKSLKFYAHLYVYTKDAKIKKKTI